MNSRLKSVENKIINHIDTENRLNEIEVKSASSQELLTSVDCKLKKVEISSQCLSSFENRLTEVEIQSSNRSRNVEDRIKYLENKASLYSSTNEDFIDYLKQENSERQNNILISEKSKNIFLTQENTKHVHGNRLSADIMLGAGKNGISSMTILEQNHT